MCFFDTKRAVCLLVLGAAILGAHAQQPPANQLPPPVVRVTTRHVLVDVIAVGKKGQLVTDLTKGDFVLEEDGKPQAISFFSLERAGQPPQGSGAAAMPPPPGLPPDAYTNRPENIATAGPLLILLLDGLNTSVQDQGYAREQMLKYLRTQLRPGRRVAVMALVNRLLLLQDFTFDPAPLMAALERYQPGKAAAQIQEEPLQLSFPRLPDALAAGLLAAVERFEQERISVSRESRVQTTLAALEAIAHATAAYPGRKNLVWISAAFPISLAPGGAGQRSYTDPIHRVTNLLAEAHVAVYPVDARGLALPPAMEAASPGPEDALGRPPRGTRAGRATALDLERNLRELSASQAVMEQLAAETGGRAYYNYNDIERAVDLSASDASTYYLLGYYPTDKDGDGRFRRIKVSVARRGVTVRHRRGYYALDRKLLAAVTGSDEALLAALQSPLPATALPFWARTAPASHPSGSIEVEFYVDTDSIAFVPHEGGSQHCELSFFVAAFSPAGELKAHLGKSAQWTLSADVFARLRQQRVLVFHYPLEVPPGDYQLSLAVRDNTTGLLGTLKIPLRTASSGAAGR